MTVPGRKIEVKGKMEKRTEWRQQNESKIEGEKKWQTCWCCRDQQKQALTEKLEHTGPTEKERMAAFAKRKRIKAICPDHHIGRRERVKMSESRTLEKKGGSERRHREETVDSIVKEGTFQGGQAKRTSLAEVEGSMSG